MAGKTNGHSLESGKKMTGTIQDHRLEDRVSKIESLLKEKPSTLSPLDVSRLVDDAIRPVRETHFDSFKVYTTVLFTSLALLVGISGVLSRIEVRDQMKEMQTQFDKQAAVLQKKFEDFAGESLKRPQIQLLHDGRLLEGQSIPLPFQANVSPKSATIDSLFIRNTGDKTTEPIALRIAINRPVFLTYHGNPHWEQATSYEKEYVSAFYSSKQVSVHPGETFNIQPLALDWVMGQHPDNTATNVRCKLEVFYGGARPSEATFTAAFEPN